MEGILRNLECSVCLEFAEDHRQCPECAQLFCKQCLINWFAKKCEEECPYCCSKYAITLWTHSPAIQKILDSMEETCAKCGRLITKGSRSAHTLTDCPNEKIPCPNEECGITELRCLMNTHLEKCPYSLIYCLCGHSMLLKDFLAHQNSWCWFTKELDPLKEKAQEALKIASMYAEDTEKHDKITSILKELEKPFTVAIVGEFNSGKTMFLNALLSCPLLQVKMRPTTAVNILVRYSDCDSYRYYKQTSEDSLEEPIDADTFDKLAYMTTNESRALKLDYQRPFKLIVEGRIESLKYTRVQLLDTPGVGEKKSFPLDELKKVDACILIVEAGRLNSHDTTMLLREVCSLSGQVFPVINKCDTLDEEELKTVKEEATSVFGDGINCFISAKNSVSGGTQWTTAFQQMATGLNVFLRENPVRGRAQRLGAELELLYKEMVWTKSVSDGPVVFKMVNKILSLSLNGYDDVFFEGAADLARRYSTYNYDSADQCVDALVRWQMLYNFGSGFLTSLGGVLTLPVSVPASQFALWVVSARLAGAIAVCYGHDLSDVTVQEAVLLCLMGDMPPGDVRDLLATEKVMTKNIPMGSVYVVNNFVRAAVVSAADMVVTETTKQAAKKAARQIARKAARDAIKETAKKSLSLTKNAGLEVARSTLRKVYQERLPEETAKALGSKLLGIVTVKSVKRAIPVVSGFIGGFMDSSFCNKVGSFAKEVFRQ